MQTINMGTCKKIFTTILITICLLLPTVLTAQPDKIVEELHLSPEQHEAIKDLMIEKMTSMQTLETTLQIKQLELKQLILADDMDSRAIRKKLEEISAIEVDIRYGRIEYEIKVMGLLDKEQKQRYKFFRIKQYERRQKKRQSGMMPEREPRKKG